MSLVFIDPKKAIHPRRKKMSNQDWDRLNRIVVESSDEECSTEELDAYQDYLYDIIAAKLQTHDGITILQ